MADSIFDLLQPEIVEQGEGRAQLRFRVRPEFTIPGEMVQGGIVAAMLDMTMVYASGVPLATASLHLELFRPAKGPELTVVGRVPRRGRRIVFAEAEMTDASGQLIARGRQTAVPPA